MMPEPVGALEPDTSASSDDKKGHDMSVKCWPIARPAAPFTSIDTCPRSLDASSAAWTRSSRTAVVSQSCSFRSGPIAKSRSWGRRPANSAHRIVNVQAERQRPGTRQPDSRSERAGEENPVGCRGPARCS